ncbi:MAG: NADH-quinone oxidoreductase subunit NuoK [Candidatus Hydrogenedentota bacterium]
MITTQCILLVSSILFVLGLFAILCRKNLVAVLMGIELIFNSASLNFVLFANSFSNPVEGIIFAIFIITIAAGEAAVALAIVFNIFQLTGEGDIDSAESLKY